MNDIICFDESDSQVQKFITINKNKTIIKINGGY